MGNFGKILIESALAFLVVGSIYTGEIEDFSKKIEEFRKATPVIGINSTVNPSTIDFQNIFGEAGKANFTNLEIYYIPLKKSEATLLKTGGQTILVNTGTASDVEDLKFFLKTQDVNRIDHLILTLPTDENMGGAANLVDTMNVDKIYMPLVSLDNIMVENFLRVLMNKKQKLTQINKGDTIDIGRARIEILNVLNSEPKNKTDASIAFVLTLDEKSFLFTGDLEKKKQKDIYWPDVDVLKIGNLGRDEYVSQDLVEKAKPEYVIGTNYKGEIDKNIENLINLIKTEKKAEIEMFKSTSKDIILLKCNGEEISMFQMPYPKKD